MGSEGIMKQIKSVPRYRCDFCKRVSTKSAMTLHEQRCFRNPKRFCDYCNNTKEITAEILEGNEIKQDCPYCAKRDKALEASIAKREAEEKENEKKVDNKEIPF